MTTNKTPKRNPVQRKKVCVSLPVQLLERLDARPSAYTRSMIVEGAVAQYLERTEQNEATPADLPDDQTD